MSSVTSAKKVTESHRKATRLCTCVVCVETPETIARLVRENLAPPPIYLSQLRELEAKLTRCISAIEPSDQEDAPQDYCLKMSFEQEGLTAQQAEYNFWLAKLEKLEERETLRLEGWLKWHKAEIRHRQKMRVLSYLVGLWRDFVVFCGLGKSAKQNLK